MHSSTRLFAVAATLAAFAFAAQAQQTAAPAKAAQPAAESVTDAFKRLDANQDGKVSRDEAARMPAIADKFDQLDTNKDGQLSADEFNAAFTAPKP